MHVQKGEFRRKHMGQKYLLYINFCNRYNKLAETKGIFDLSPRLYGHQVNTGRNECDF